MPTPQQQIDSFLGSGWFDEWLKMDQQLKDAENRFYVSKRLLHLSITAPLLDRLYNDLGILNKIATDYRQGMNLVVSGRRRNKEQLGQVHDLYTLALGVAETENDVLEALFGTGFAAAWVMMPFALLQYKAQVLLQALDPLKEELKKAEHEVSNARNKRAFHLAVTFIEAIFPEISLASRAAIFLGDVIVDKALGPDDPTTKQRYAGIVPPGVKQFSEAVHHIPAYSKGARAVAEQTGKVATLATFYFDFEEISEGEERVEKFKELIKKVKEAYDALVKVIEDNKPKIQLFLAAFERWMRAIESVRLTAGNIRQALAEDIKRYNYSRTQTLAWPVTS